MKSESKASGMEKVATFIVDKKTFFIALFLAAAIFCAFSRNWVQVNESLTDYLPEETETRQGVDLMEREFVTYSTADVMIQNVTYDQAVALQEQLEEIPGVKEIELDETSDHYADASALFSITFDGSDEDEVSIQALDRVKEHLAPYDMYYSSNVGNPLKAIIDREMLLVDLIAVVIIITVLLITSQTYMEIPVLLLS